MRTSYEIDEWHGLVLVIRSQLVKRHLDPRSSRLSKKSDEQTHHTKNENQNVERPRTVLSILIHMWSALFMAREHFAARILAHRACYG